MVFRYGSSIVLLLWNNCRLLLKHSISGRLSRLAYRAVVVIMMPMLAFSVDIFRISRVAMTIFSHANAMLRTLLFHIMHMHERKKPCKDIAQQKENMVDF